jgi:hypothetical protein
MEVEANEDGSSEGDTGVLGEAFLSGGRAGWRFGRE